MALLIVALDEVEEHVDICCCGDTPRYIYDEGVVEMRTRSCAFVLFCFACTFCFVIDWAGVVEKLMSIWKARSR